MGKKRYFLYSETQAEVLRRQQGGHYALVIESAAPPMIPDTWEEYTHESPAPPAGGDSHIVWVLDKSEGGPEEIRFVVTDQARRDESFRSCREEPDDLALQRSKTFIRSPRELADLDL